MELYASLILFQIINGIIWGLIVALLAVGLNLVYGLLGIVNVAQGALFMAGAYVCWYVGRATGNYAVGVVSAAAFVGPLCVIFERVVLRRVEDEPYLTIILTIGLMLVLQEGALAVFGGDVRTVESPIAFAVPLLGLAYPGFRVVLAVGAIIALVGLWAFVRFSRHGLWMRAVSQSPNGAAAQGVPVNRIYALTFGIGTALAALGGALAAPIVNVNPHMGFDILITVFIVVIVGGLGNIGGSIIIAVLFSASIGLASVFVSPTNAQVIALVVMAAIVFRWPEGLPLMVRFAR